MKEKPQEEGLVAVLAGDIRQFNSRAKGQKNYIYIDRPEKLRGYRFSKVEIFGTFWRRNDAGELYEEVEMTNPHLID